MVLDVLYYDEVLAKKQQIAAQRQVLAEQGTELFEVVISVKFAM
jgi:hypothetical protein